MGLYKPVPTHHYFRLHNIVSSILMQGGKPLGGFKEGKRMYYIFIFKSSFMHLRAKWVGRR